nr:zf-TFIIB domain-containing protein [Pseudogemmobacter bohemicus]
MQQPGQGLLCPSCRVNLVMSERLGIEIDYCPNCRGVWLDRGELDKIIERSLGELAVQPQARPEPLRDPGPARRDSYYEDQEYRSGYSGNRHGGHHGSSHGGHHGGHRGGHGSFLRRLFD